MFLELDSKGLYQSSGKEKESCCLVFPSSTKREKKHWRCSRARTATKCAKKRDARKKLLFCQSKPIALLPFSWLSPLSLLQLPLKLRRRRQCEPMSGYWNKKNDNSAREHAFLYNFLVVVPACTITTWNDKISSSLENVNAKAINFAIPVCTRTRALANFPSQVTGWHGIIAKTFYWHRRCRIVT